MLLFARMLLKSPFALTIHETKKKKKSHFPFSRTAPRQNFNAVVSAALI